MLTIVRFIRSLFCEMLIKEEFPAVKDTNRSGTVTKVSENLKPVLCDTTVLLMLICQWEVKSIENQTFRLLFCSDYTSTNAKAIIQGNCGVLGWDCLSPFLLQ